MSDVRPEPAPRTVPQAAVAPGICLVVLNGMSILAAVVSAIWTSLVSEMIGRQAQSDPRMRQAAEFYAMLDDTALHVVFGVLGLAALAGSICMIVRRPYWMAVTGAVLSILNIGACCNCCCLNVGIGIWALVVLMREADPAA
jgi:hypothetical protein